MKVLLLCGVFAKENEKEIIENSKRAVEYSANIFQEKLIEGFEETVEDFSVLSAPFIGAYPIAYKQRVFKGFQEEQNKYEYVHFNNIWGIRNFSRAKSLKTRLQEFIKDLDKEKLIVVYSPHTPFLEAAVYAKKKDPNIKICLIVPDLPQYMNLNKKKSLLYRIGKSFDIKKFNKLNKNVDSYMLLTEAMKEKLAIGNRPYIVVEGIISKADLKLNEKKKKEVVKNKQEKYIVYTGKLNEKFGIVTLVNAFEKLDNEHYRLVLCGNGDCVPYIEECAKKDDRILYLGQITPDVARDWIYKADVLVNPRPNNEEYTKYSFPSKNIEYLMSGNPVVAYMLDGMKEEYKEYLNAIENENDLPMTIKAVLEREIKENGFLNYAKKNLQAKKVAESLIKIAKER